MKRKLTAEQQARAVACIPLAKQIARKLVRRRRVFHLRALARSTALEALVEAASTYDPTYNVPFDRFARRRIRGEVTDMINAEEELFRAWYSDALDSTDLIEDPSHTLPDSDDETTALMDSMGDEVMAGVILRFVGEILRTPGKKGVALRQMYAGAIKFAQDAVARLSAEDQQLVDLHSFQGLSWETVVERLGGSASTWKRRHQGIRRRIARDLRARRRFGATKTGKEHPAPPPRPY